MPMSGMTVPEEVQLSDHSCKTTTCRCCQGVLHQAACFIGKCLEQLQGLDVSMQCLQRAAGARHPSIE